MVSDFRIFEENGSANHILEVFGFEKTNDLANLLVGASSKTPQYYGMQLLVTRVTLTECKVLILLHNHDLFMTFTNV